MRMRLPQLVIVASISTIAAAIAFAPAASQPGPVEEPIAYIGHGAMFDRHGKELEVTLEFVAKAQSWYRRQLELALPEKDRAALPQLETRLKAGLALDGADKLMADQQVLSWMVARIPRARGLARVPGKLALLERKLRQLTKDRIGPKLDERLKLLDPELKRKPDVVFLATINKGELYNKECADASVPIPPPINQMASASQPFGWTSQGFIPRDQQFIVGSPAEVRTYEDGNGVCVALPRYDETDGDPTTNETSVAKLDGVICLSKVSAKTCFWDNTNDANPLGFDIPAGTVVPIGFAGSGGGLYQAGGAEIEFKLGGVCTDCHAGENPFVVHPEADIGGGLLFGELDWRSPQRYIPIVGGSWPQNLQSHSLATVPTGCKTCHTQTGTGGRLPHLYLSEDPRGPGDTFDSLTWDRDGLDGYCNTVLRQAVGNNAAQSGLFAAPATMPQGSEGSMTSTSASSPLNATTHPLVSFRAFCGQPRSAGPSNRGDPHLITTDGTSYDFQAAGEFVALRNSANGFELQTRQTPVTTTFTPGANPYTGLASCVSLNTAIAARLGKRRISYQSPAKGSATGRPLAMELRIDGVLTTLLAVGISLGGGNRIDPLASGDGIRLTGDDGTKVAVTPNFWSSQGYWYLNVEVEDTTAREGTMGTILPSNWLPLAPNGQSFGVAPATLGDRHVLLNQKFADAWRVRPRRSLFDYSLGTSTAAFTDVNWPSPPGGSCTSTTIGIGGAVPQVPPLERKVKAAIAERLCQRLRDPKAREECSFDVQVMGDNRVLTGYSRSLLERGAL
jgi:hypothetical protein